MTQISNLQINNNKQVIDLINYTQELFYNINIFENNIFVLENDNKRKKIIEKSLNLNNRRYIGNKHKLNDWIFSLISKECKGETFADIFGGTGSVAGFASKYFKNIIINDFLYSNYAIYQAFFSSDSWDKDNIINIISEYNEIDGSSLKSNYFSNNFGGKYFSIKSSKLIGYIREDIEKKKDELTKKEYYILIASLLYSIDKIANTVGHYDAYFKKDNLNDFFEMKLINPINIDNVEIFQDDANDLVKNIKADIVYIDPPYNSRQYSRFYHVLENLTQWKKPKLYGVALKPDPEKMSDYCKVSAGKKFSELINDLDAKYLVTSYNNTYKSKSNSSKNKITLEEMESILNAKGKTKVFEKSYKHFNTGNTNFDDHKEFLFITKVTNGGKNS